MSERYETQREIASQPGIWASWSAELQQRAGCIREWIAERRPKEIWLCGAGTSGFIADSLVTSLNGSNAATLFRAVPTTDLVACPHLYLNSSTSASIVSLGRSGDSPETVGTLELLDRLAPQVDRLNITCNRAGALASEACLRPGEQRTMILPDACHDSGFAMTSSYTTMLLSALACLGTEPIDSISSRLEVLSSAAETYLESAGAYPLPSRAIFLGSGPFVGTARESALKVLELTAGQVVTSWDTTLGFRHGPKAIVDDQSAVFIFLSGNPLTRRYDHDVAVEIRQQYPAIPVTTIGVSMTGFDPPDVPMAGTGADLWDTALFILFSQLVAVSWSKLLGLNVDNPFADGNLTRVVSNVRLYR